MEPQTILVTGAAGFIGSHTARRFRDLGHHVIGLDDLSQGAKTLVPDGIEFHTVDIRDRNISQLFKGVDIVFHLAAKNSLSDCEKDPVATMDINVTGTANVFDASLKNDVRKVVYAQSSVLEEGEKRKGFYAISKAANEMLALGFARHGLVTVGLRYFNVYGPGQDYRRTMPPVMSSFIITLLQGRTPVLFEGDEKNKRDFIYVDDIIDFHELCITDARVDGKMFRLGTGEAYSIQEVLLSIQKLLGTSLNPDLRPRASHDTVTQTLADITDARALGWSPKTSLEEGLRSMIEYIKQEISDGRIQ